MTLDEARTVIRNTSSRAMSTALNGTEFDPASGRYFAAMVAAEAATGTPHADVTMSGEEAVSDLRAFADVEAGISRDFADHFKQPYLDAVDTIARAIHA